MLTVDQIIPKNNPPPTVTAALFAPRISSNGETINPMRGAKTPAPTRKKSQGQNCSVPLRSSTQFSQLIHAALFCAALTRRVKGHPQSRDKKARPRLLCQTIRHRKTRQPSPGHLLPTPARRPAGRGQGKGANPSRPLPLLFPPEQKNSGVPAARVFSISPKQLHRPF